MSISGEELYEHYVDAQGYLNNCAVDDWEDLPQSEKEVWERVAEKVNLAY